MENINNDNGQIDSKQAISSTNKGKKRCRRNIPSTKKNKPSPVLKVDEETIATGTIINENAVNPAAEGIPSDVENGVYLSNSSSEDDSSLAEIVFSKILNQKKMELMECEEIREQLRPKKKK